ncbi:MAG TPA: hypothetical protein VK929_00705 [Longimicrobiales bacterium]|nr:hypothetical protein [Longimicrobiales bacterium]
MEAVFRAETAFPLDQRKVIVVQGRIVEGSVRAGMFLHIPFNPAVKMTARIDSVEYIDHQIGGESSIGLCLKYEDTLHRNVLLGLNIGAEDLVVSDEGED